MNTKYLIDAIVRQVTVLIAQLSTAAGVRAPLAHVADQVFLELANEIEAQGVGRKVVADMFGLALRSYQKRVQRLTAAAGDTQTTLWSAVLEYATENAPVARAQVLQRFRYDGEAQVAAVLNDLVSTGFLTRTGRGSSCIYGVANEQEIAALADMERAETLGWLLWVTICRNPGVGLEGLIALVPFGAEDVTEALDHLLEEGRVIAEDSGDEVRLYGETLTIPIGSSQGWELAIFDHFQAVCTAIGLKLRQGASSSSRTDTVGGATLGFDLYPGHPHEEEVKSLLSRVRNDINEVWERVHAHNVSVNTPEEEKTRAVFYCGQYFISRDDED